MALDVLVLGGGPAGRALAGACAQRGLRTALADPDPDRPWTATYCAWPEELPADLPESAVAARPVARAVLPGPGGDRDLGPYTVLDTAGLRAHLDGRLGDVTVLTGRADPGDVRPRGPGSAAAPEARARHLGAPGPAGGIGHRLRRPGASGPAVGFGHRIHRPGATGPATGIGQRLRRPSAPGPAVDFGHQVHLRLPGAPGPVVTAALVVDATGAPSRLRPEGGPRAEQTAYGVVVPAAAAAPVVAAGEAVFMDWRPPPHGPGRTDAPTFLYAVPYGDGRVLLEETSLARRPGLPLPELRDRLAARLAALGVTVPDGAPVERVRFPVDSPRGTRHPVPFGAATPLVHPATGFGVATALRLAPELAAVLARHLPGDPAAATAAAHRLLWSPSARAVHCLRRQGLRTVLELPAPLVPGFFDAFFAAPGGRAFLTGRDDVTGTIAGMAGVFRAASPQVRAHMLRSASPFHPNGS